MLVRHDGDESLLVLVALSDANRGERLSALPLHAVARDIAEGRLVELSIEEAPPGGLPLPMFAVYREGEPPGPAGRWMIERLKNCSEGVTAKEGSRAC